MTVTVSATEFHRRSAHYFDLASRGAQVTIRRRNRSRFVLQAVPQDDKPEWLTPEVEQELEQARKDYREGKGTVCRTADELDAFLESL